VQEEFILSAIY